MKTIQNIKATFSTLFIGILCVLGVTIGAIVITNPFMLVVPVVWLMEIPRDISHEPKYSEIYNQSFELQQDLFLCQWEDSKKMVLRKDDDWSSWCPVIAKVEKGTRFRVKKIVLRHRWAGEDLKILVQIDDPRFSGYKVNSRRAISATDLTTHRLSYSDVVEKVQFDPELLKKVTPQGQHSGLIP